MHCSFQARDCVPKRASRPFTIAARHQRDWHLGPDEDRRTDLWDAKDVKLVLVLQYLDLDTDVPRQRPAKARPARPPTQIAMTRSSQPSKLADSHAAIYDQYAAEY
jgi:hypothetical protein